MSDFINKYKQRVRKLLACGEDEPNSGVAEALCFPAFHPETILQVTNGPAGCTLRLATFGSSLWYSEQGKVTRGEPPVLQEVVSISAEKAQQFWNSVEPLRTKGFTVANTIGCDGISVQAFYRQADSSISCDTWNPDPASPVGMFIYLIYDLAWEVLREEASLDRLEHLHGYLKHELPVRMIDGDVRCLRIFGRLASNDENDLRQALGSLPMAEPMVVDMTNFEGMGTLLYPIFIQFASTHRHIAWSVSSAAKHHLEAMALSSPHVFETREDAVKWLNDYSKNLG